MYKTALTKLALACYYSDLKGERQAHKARDRNE